MRDVFLDVLWACGSVCALAFTVAVIKTAHDYVRNRLFRPRPQVFVSPPTASTGTTATSVVFQSPPVHTARIPEVMESVFPPLVNEPSAPRSTPSPITTPEDFVLECGNCRKQIKSQPVKIQAMGAGKTEMRYRCEHCGSMVAVKV